MTDHTAPAIISAIAATFLLAAPAQAHEYRTVSWYVEHPREAHEVMRLCANNAGLAHKNPNCLNAEQSLGDADYRDFVRRGTKIFGG